MRMMKQQCNLLLAAALCVLAMGLIGGCSKSDQTSESPAPSVGAPGPAGAADAATATPTPPPGVPASPWGQTAPPKK